MVTFFPTPYPDELLYSILARYYVWSANISPKLAIEELFGRRTVIATFDLPSHIESLIKNLPFGSKHTIENFIRQNTLYPFYEPFLPPNRAKIILASMRQHFSGDIHTRSGIMASSIPQIKYFRFCQICLHEDISRFGEPYWHRIHQIVGILVCPIHQVWIQNSTVKVQGHNRHEFYASDVENCISKPVLVNYDKSTHDKLFALSQDVNELFKQKFTSHDGEWFQARYQSFLIDRGLATASGRIYQKDFAYEFKNFYGKQFLKLIHSTIDLESDHTWLSAIVRKHRKVFHPLRHLLMIRFLGESVSKFFKNEEIIQHSFGAGPWTCFNGASSHYLQKNIREVLVTYSSDIKKLVATFPCKCGFTYSTTEPSVSYSQKLSYGKIKTFGRVWERKLKKLLVEKKSSFREVARQLKVDTRTVIRHAKRLGFIDEEKKIESNQKNPPLSELLAEKKNEYRRIWIEVRKKDFFLSKTELRKKNPKVYIWLYRNDPKWLEKHSPPKKKNVSQRKVVDWEIRDREIYSQAKHIIQELLIQSPPIRITKNAVAKRLGLKTLIEKHLNKLIETTALFEEMTESVEQFQLRRIRLVISKLFIEKSEIKKWEVVRLAGLKKVAVETFDEIITKEIELFYYQKQKKVI